MESSDVVTEKFRHVEAALQEIRNGLRELRDTVEDGARWRAGTEEVLDSMIERIDGVCDNVERLEAKTNGHQTFIDQFKGGKQATINLVGTLIAAVSGIVAVATLFLKLK